MKMSHMLALLGCILVVTVVGIWLASGPRSMNSELESELAKLDGYDFRWYEPGGGESFQQEGT